MAVTLRVKGGFSQGTINGVNTTILPLTVRYGCYDNGRLMHTTTLSLPSTAVNFVSHFPYACDALMITVVAHDGYDDIYLLDNERWTVINGNKWVRYAKKNLSRWLRPRSLFDATVAGLIASTLLIIFVLCKQDWHMN